MTYRAWRCPCCNWTWRRTLTGLDSIRCMVCGRDAVAARVPSSQRDCRHRRAKRQMQAAIVIIPIEDLRPGMVVRTAALGSRRVEKITPANRGSVTVGRRVYLEGRAFNGKRSIAPFDVRLGSTVEVESDQRRT